jgi:hypothetical protein
MRPTLLPVVCVHPWHPDAVHEGSDDAPGARYTERLWAPVTWWVVVLVLVATLALALGVPLGLVAGVLTMAAGAVVTTWLLVRAAALVQVQDGVLVAGRARLPVSVVASVTPLDPAAARALRGPGADARAYLLLRPWVSTAVRVDLADPDDPTPYWYVATRRPRELASALGAATGAADASAPRDGAG